VGSCPQMEEIFSTIRKIAPSDVSVLIQGESGTGKELVARAIHALSLRAGEGFIPINCGAIPENLLESELFGHEKGAFTGAYTQVQGKLEYAHNGTLFLDEIGDLPLNLQVKMLRFLQEKCIQRVGGRDDIPVDARIIAATNIDIEKAISAGKFREDLYYRLGVIMVKVPSLRERGEDVMLLSNLFLKKYSTEFKKNIKGFDQACIEQVTSYNWPGNVRELENRIQRAVIMADSSLIAPQSLGLSMNAAKKGGLFSGKVTLKEAKEQVEKEIISVAMERHKGNIAKAAEDLGISRPTLYDLLKKYT
ncbi:MAG: sigma 54-interacting transcriptional regulator, partial [Nitrospirales bacterium]|nr:sigma 54-interacting transcriptional regulator [Nitrospirales bacterium]